MVRPVAAKGDSTDSGVVKTTTFSCVSSVGLPPASNRQIEELKKLGIEVKPNSCIRLADDGKVEIFVGNPDHSIDRYDINFEDNTVFKYRIEVTDDGEFKPIKRTGVQNHLSVD